MLLGALVAPFGILAARECRRRAMTFGATQEETGMGLPGDQLVRAASRMATRAISIDAPPEQVWPWLVQLGQGRGGFYSYDSLENLIGLNIHSAQSIEQRWQNLAVGDQVNLAEGMSLDVAILEPERELVLRGGELPDEVPAPDFDFTWAFVLHPAGGATRLVVRERYRAGGLAAAPMVSVAMWLSALMTRKMLRGIKERAERP